MHSFAKGITQTISVSFGDILSRPRWQGRGCRVSRAVDGVAASRVWMCRDRGEDELRSAAHTRTYTHTLFKITSGGPPGSEGLPGRLALLCLCCPLPPRGATARLAHGWVSSLPSEASRGWVNVPPLSTETCPQPRSPNVPRSALGVRFSLCPRLCPGPPRPRSFSSHRESVARFRTFHIVMLLKAPPLSPHSFASVSSLRLLLTRPGGQPPFGSPATSFSEF